MTSIVSTSPERKMWLDALRGIAMILVVYGHCVHGWRDFFVFTSPIKMPLFFAISGYLFNPRGGDQKLFFKNIFIKLIIPWLVLGLFPYTNPIGRLLDLLSGKALWFMPCLIISEILWFYVHKLAKSSLQVITVGILLSAIGFAMHNYNVLRYAMINTAFIVQVYFVMGYLIRMHEDLLERRWTLWVLMAIVVYIILGCITQFFLLGTLDVHLNRYYNFPICIIMIVLGLATLFTFFRMKSLSPKWLVYVGQNTLVIYIMHGFIIAVFNKMLAFIGIINMPVFIIALLKTIIACLGCCFIAYFANKYIPEIVGKKR